MSLLRTLGCVGVLAVAMTPAIAPALAADMPRNFPPEPVPVVERPQPRFFGNSGWYLRGDLGYRWGVLDGADSAPGFADPSENKFGNSYFGGIGGGIKTEWLRTDITVEYGSAMKYEGQIAAPGDVTAKISSINALFNGYIDLGTWHGVTPYIGAGVGAASVRAYDYASTVAPPFAGGLSNTKWQFAWGLMAGAGYAISRNVMVDLGYRYLNLGDVTTASDAFGAMTFKNVAAHEVRLGLRWSFDDFPVTR